MDSIPALEDTLVDGMATHSSILAWRVPGTDEPGGQQSVGLQRVGYDWSDLACKHISKLKFYPDQINYRVVSHGSLLWKAQKSILNMSQGKYLIAVIGSIMKFMLIYGVF